MYMLSLPWSQSEKRHKELFLLRVGFFIFLIMAVVCVKVLDIPAVGIDNMCGYEGGMDRPSKLSQQYKSCPHPPPPPPPQLSWAGRRSEASALAFSASFCSQY